MDLEPMVHLVPLQPWQCGRASLPERPKCSTKNTPPKLQSLKNVLPSLVLSRKPGVLPASYPWHYVLGHVNLSYSACYNYSFGVKNVIDDTEKRKLQR